MSRVIPDSTRGPHQRPRHETQPIADHLRGDREPTRCPRRRPVGVSKSRLFELLARCPAEGKAAFERRSRRPNTGPRTTPSEVVDLILEYREKLTTTGQDAGPDTIKWHLEQHRSTVVSRDTISRYLQAHGLVIPEPKKKPKAVLRPDPSRDA